MAIDFDGTDDEIRCIASTAANITIAAWVFPEDNGTSSDANGDRRTIISNFWFDATPFGYTLDMTAEKFRAYFGNSAGGAGLSAPSTSSTGAWYHAAATYDGADKRLYVNGVLVSSAANANALQYHVSSTGRIGRSGQINDDEWNGYIEDVRIFNRALSANEVATLAAGYRGPLGGEVLWLPMREVDGATLSSAAAVVFDMSGNGNHGTPQGGCVGRASYAPRMSGWIPQ